MLILLLLLSGLSAPAWQPTGWVYFSWPWAYDAATGDWHWFSAGASDELWAYGHPPADGWRRIQSSGLANGWSYHAWPYAYDQSLGAWFYLNEPDEQWCVNMRTETWSLFGLPVGMALIPGGTNTGTDPDFGAYTLTEIAFYMDRFEVRKALWDEVKGWASSHGYVFSGTGAGKGPDHPAESVSWYDAIIWCNARSEMEGRAPYYYKQTGVLWIVYRSGEVEPTPLPSANGYRLPTSLQWEYAGRGGLVSRRFPWSVSNTIDFNLANYYSDWRAGVPVYPYDLAPAEGHHPLYASGGEPYTARVGLFAANGYGLHDMAGNVWEWCFDWHPSYIGSQRVLRGGSWNTVAAGCQVGGKEHLAPGTPSRSVGFRTVLPAPP